VALSGQQIVNSAKAFLGRPYRYGAAGPSAFDCSGLVQYVLLHLGLHGVPRTAAEQWHWSTHISKAQLQPGDLIFEQWPGDSGYPGHVVIYAGGGKVVEAPHTGANVRLRAWSPKETQIVGYGRAPGLAAAPDQSGGGGPSLTGGLMSLAFPADALRLFSDAGQVFTKMMWILNPENWARIIAGVFGVFLAAAGIGFLIKAGA
jgi:NlpC/P60 family